MIKLFLLPVLFITFNFEAWADAQAPKGMKKIPAGTYTPFLSDGDGDNRPVKLKAFWLDESPVTNAQFNQFVAANESWRKSKIVKLFGDENYLAGWSGDQLSDEELKEIGERPVVYVSWFAARAYCEEQGKRLPTVNEWEYGGDSDNPNTIKKILKWYGTVQTHASKISDMAPGKHGIRGMHGHIWEWVEDYNSVLITQDSRNSPGDNALDGLFCGGGSLRSKDSSDYASFMRYAFRSGLSGKYTYSLLGFRCAQDV